MAAAGLRSDPECTCNTAARPLRAITEKLLTLEVGGSCVVNKSRVDLSAARKHAPDRQWRSEGIDGVRLVTRVL